MPVVILDAALFDRVVLLAPPVCRLYILGTYDMAGGYNFSIARDASYCEQIVGTHIVSSKQGHSQFDISKVSESYLVCVYTTRH